ncbi:MAG: UpxY family transcription antiterminator [Ferruginibacter sp.]|nr:UpxY family transcription antiterminator [Ferruginibacter sp.]
MKRNWYAVYTRPQREKKVASILTKKGIKNYFAVNNIISLNANNKKASKEALFNSFVFIYITESEIASVKEIPGILNFIYWIAKPAIIQREEIEAIKQLTSSYHNIKLEKSMVNTNDIVRIIDEPVISFKENSASVRFQTLKIILPSLGYIMIAERDKVNEEILQQDLIESGFFPKKLNPFFSN